MVNVTIYSSTMDPMGYNIWCLYGCHADISRFWLKLPLQLWPLGRLRLPDQSWHVQDDRTPRDENDQRQGQMDGKLTDQSGLMGQDQILALHWQLVLYGFVVLFKNDGSSSSKVTTVDNCSYARQHATASIVRQVHAPSTTGKYIHVCFCLPLPASSGGRIGYPNFPN